MDSKALHFFTVVAESGSISMAARRLNTVQSNVTTHIRRLEEEVGQALFVRNRRGVSLTAAGETLLTHARMVLSAMEQARRAVDGDDGRLAIGSMESTLATRLVPLLADLRKARPGLRLQLHTGPSDDLIADVLSGRLDAAFIGGRTRHPELAEYPAFDEEIVLLTDTDTGDPATIATRPLLVFKQGCSYRSMAEHWRRFYDRAPVEIMEMGTLDGILAATAAGIGVTLMPRIVAERPFYQGQLRCWPAGDAPLILPTVLIRRAEMKPSAALAALLARLPVPAGGR